MVCAEQEIALQIHGAKTRDDRRTSPETQSRSVKSHPTVCNVRSTLTIEDERWKVFIAWHEKAREK